MSLVFAVKYLWRWISLWRRTVYVLFVRIYLFDRLSGVSDGDEGVPRTSQNPTKDRRWYTWETDGHETSCTHPPHSNKTTPQRYSHAALAFFTRRKSPSPNRPFSSYGQRTTEERCTACTRRVLRIQSDRIVVRTIRFRLPMAYLKGRGSDRSYSLLY